MEIKQQYLQKYLHNIAVDQLSADYETKGYAVTKEEQIGRFHADLVARKDEEVVVVEVKTGKMTQKKREELSAIGDFVRNQKNYKFLVVVAIPPRRKKIDIPNLDQLLFDYLLDHPPGNFDSLSSHTRITDVSDVVVNELTVAEDGHILAEGNGIVEVELRYGSESDEAEDVFPFSFKVALTQNQNRELILAETESIEVDVSSFFE